MTTGLSRREAEALEDHDGHHTNAINHELYVAEAEAEAEAETKAMMQRRTALSGAADGASVGECNIISFARNNELRRSCTLLIVLHATKDLLSKIYVS